MIIKGHPTEITTFIRGWMIVGILNVFFRFGRERVDRVHHNIFFEAALLSKDRIINLKYSYIVDYRRSRTQKVISVKTATRTVDHSRFLVNSLARILKERMFGDLRRFLRMMRKADGWMNVIHVWINDWNMKETDRTEWLPVDNQPSHVSMDKQERKKSWEMRERRNQFIAIEQIDERKQWAKDEWGKNKRTSETTTSSREVECHSCIKTRSGTNLKLANNLILMT